MAVTRPFELLLAPSWQASELERPGAVVLPVSGAVILIAIWGFAALGYDVTILPSPAEALEEGLKLLAGGELAFHALASLQRLLIGFLIGSAIAIPIGFAMGLVPFFRRMMEPITEFFRYIPAIAMVVFALIWFGIGEASKVFLIFYNTFFSVALATEAGVKHISQVRINAVRSLGANRRQVLQLVIVPSVVPYAIQGMRMGMGRAFATIVSAEILAANSGLGFLIFSSREFSRMDTVVVAIAVLGVLGIVIDRLFRRLTRVVGGAYLPSEMA